MYLSPRTLAYVLLGLGLIRPIFAQCPTSAQFLRELPNPYPEMGDSYGQAVAISNNRVVIGSPYDRNGSNLFAGRTFVYDASNGTTISLLENPAPNDADTFGFSVGISGELAVVGAPNADPGGIAEAGSAYVFNVITGELQASLVDPSPQIVDNFGRSVAISGNLAMVGAPGNSPGGIGNVGSAYIFNATTGELQATLLNPVPEVDDHFGVAVAIDGNRAVVGALGDGLVPPMSEGLAFVFDASTGVLQFTLPNPTPAQADRFGSAVAISGDRIVVGCERDRTGFLEDIGRVYLFSALDGSRLTEFPHPVPGDSEFFGLSVSISGETILAGRNPSVSESVYAFDAASSKLTATLTNPSADWGDAFGWTVAVSGAYAVVGAMGEVNSGWEYVGSAYIFSLNGAGMTSHLVPTYLPHSKSLPITLTACNTGATAWSAATGYALTVIADSCGNSSGSQIALDPAIIVPSGSSHTFSTTLSSLTTLGPCNLQFQMTHNGVPFGEILSVSPEVVAAVNNADLLSHTLPTTMPSNQSLTYSLNFKNTGNTAWIPNSPHALGVFTSDECNLFAQTRFQPSEPILPNKNFTAFVHITSPAAPAECTFTLQMLEESIEWFGDPLTHTITIADPPNASRNWAIYQ